jgi:hypothetical protein
VTDWREWTFTWQQGTFGLTNRAEHVTAAATPTPNTVGGGTRPGVLMPNNWQWHGLPMPANVTYVGEASNWVGFWVNAKTDSILNWYSTNWYNAGYSLAFGRGRTLESGARTYDYCARTPRGVSSTQCFTLVIQETAPGANVAYPGWTTVIVDDGRTP